MQNGDRCEASGKKKPVGEKIDERPQQQSADVSEKMSRIRHHGERVRKVATY
jgi:hypothetical protein